MGKFRLWLEKSFMDAHDEELRISKAFGANVRRLRQHRGMTQEDLAYAVGTTAAALSRVESGRANFTVRTLAKVAVALEADPVAMLIDRGEFTRFEEARVPDTVLRGSHPPLK